MSGLVQKRQPRDSTGCLYKSQFFVLSFPIYSLLFAGYWLLRNRRDRLVSRAGCRSGHNGQPEKQELKPGKRGETLEKQDGSRLPMKGCQPKPEGGTEHSIE